MTRNLSVVIVSCNTRDLLLNCLSSIAGDTRRSEVVVVDNGSTDGSSAAVQAQFPKVKVVQISNNRGYAAACMAGLRATTAPYVLFLNGDTVVPNEALRRLVAFLEERPEAAACAPRLAGTDGTAQAFSFGRDPILPYLIARACAALGLRPPLHDWETLEVQPVDWLSGACLLVRRDALEQVEGFDERIFLYFEDNDLCLRLRRAGWQVLYNPQVTITHIGGASPTGQGSRRKHYYRSLVYFYRKHYSALECFLLRILLPFYRCCYRLRECVKR